MLNINLNSVVRIVTGITFICSLLHTLLPPWETFNDFPTLQKYYKLIVYIIGYMAINARSTLYKDLSTNSGQKPSNIVTNGNVAQTPTDIQQQQTQQIQPPIDKK